jgi:DNA (cytosine-5)-methyltransferase 1
MGQRQVKIGSLCTGYGGLDMAVEAVFDAKTVWVSEIDKYASQVIKERFWVTNHGDLKTINWHEVEPIDILTAGYPCQPFSHAGERKGLNDERHIFPYILEAISILRPRYAIMENVRGHLSLGFKEVLKGLAEVGYDAKWRIVRASDVGAPHQRARLFIIAEPSNADSQRTHLGELQPTQGSQGQPQSQSCSCCKTTSNTIGERCQNKSCCKKSNEFEQSIITNADSHACKESRRTDRSIRGTTSEVINGSDRSINGCCCAIACNPNNQCVTHNWSMSQLGRRFATRCEMRMQRTPNTLDLEGRLNPVFVEYMMGLPNGWVTDLGFSRSQELKMLGNGVVPQQAEYAIHQLLNQETPS